MSTVKKKTCARMLLVMMVMAMMFAFSTVAYAADKTDFAGYQGSTNESKEVTGLIEACITMTTNGNNSTKIISGSPGSYDVPSGGASSDIKKWHIIEGKDNSGASKLYYVYSDTIGKVRSQATSTKVDSMVGDIHIEADTAGAQTMLSGLEGVISLIVGILAYIVVIALPLFTAIDVCYITIPVFREKSESVKNSGSGFGNAMTKTRKDGSTGVRFVSDEAQYAVESSSLADGKSPLKTYLFKRAGAFVMLAIVLYILIGGQINVIVKIAINLVSGIMGALGGLAG